ncbi:hypothetical protein FVE85_8869 [Porphyridium purpureum]|uniref:Uncharacterized protein n=1 Tax=Porphyridium purpureum TaxID=35688 RepID=A0A5J4YRR3_PORPP|nr:hypothetical protein FVE85_8869 [Porphyridium purpureum]|eukprot:POR0076..scf296_7
MALNMCAEPLRPSRRVGGRARDAPTRITHVVRGLYVPLKSWHAVRIRVLAERSTGKRQQCGVPACIATKPVHGNDHLRLVVAGSRKAHGSCKSLLIFTIYLGARRSALGAVLKSSEHEASLSLCPGRRVSMSASRRTCNLYILVLSQCGVPTSVVCRKPWVCSLPCGPMGVWSYDRREPIQVQIGCSKKLAFVDGIHKHWTVVMSMTAFNDLLKPFAPVKGQDASLCMTLLSTPALHLGHYGGRHC